MDAIVAVTRLPNGKLAIGRDGKLPWTSKGPAGSVGSAGPAAAGSDLAKDLEWFAFFVKDRRVLVGRRTLKGIPKKIRDTFKETIVWTPELDLGKDLVKDLGKDPLVVIGGGHVYRQTMTMVKRLFVSNIYYKKEFGLDADTFFEFGGPDWHLQEVSKHNDFEILLYKKGFNCQERDYLNLVRRLLYVQGEKSDRTGTGTKSIFGTHLRFDISKSVPLLTTKRVPVKTVLAELLWILSGSTDVKVLQDQGVHIWDANTSREFLDKTGKYDYEEGQLAYGYGSQLRNRGMDQLAYVENLLQVDPDSRRILWNLWNAADIEKMVLVPCHNQVQFYTELVDGKRHLSAHLSQRSVDTFLGFPFNIFSYAALVYLLAARHGMVPKELVVSGGDTHLYLDHLDQAREQLKTELRPPPILRVSPRVAGIPIEQVTIDDFEIIGYFPGKTIKAKMS